MWKSYHYRLGKINKDNDMGIRVFCNVLVKDILKNLESIFYHMTCKETYCFWNCFQESTEIMVFRYLFDDS